MKKLIVISILLLTSGLASADMVSNDSIGNDPVKEKLCASRAKVKKTVPFEIDSDYVARTRSYYPDATFIAVDEGNPQLIECELRSGTGRFEPASYSSEQSYWHTIKPKMFEPGINTPAGRSMAVNVCFEAVLSKSNRSEYDHSVYSVVQELGVKSAGVLFSAGTIIAGKKAERYDIVVQGTSFYKPANPDLTPVNFTCLLSPMLEVKAIQFKK